MLTKTHSHQWSLVAVLIFSNHLLKLSVSPTTAIMLETKKKGVMMILSPAKTLNLDPLGTKMPDLPLTEPDCDPDLTWRVAEAMKKRKEGDLGKLLGISSNLAKKAAGYWKDYVKEASSQSRQDGSVKPCIYSFSGAAYQGLQIHECDTNETLVYLQNCLRIVDPLYGLLRPLDCMQPYRLEMATRGVFPEDKTIKLADYWSSSVVKRLATELESFEDPILLNVASDEYSAAVNASALPAHVRYLKAVFQVDGRVIAVHAKRARGLMVRFLAETRTCCVEDIKKFDREGYSFQESKSDEKTIVFNRPKEVPATKRTAESAAKKSTTKKAKR